MASPGSGSSEDEAEEQDMEKGSSIPKLDPDKLIYDLHDLKPILK